MVMQAVDRPYPPAGNRESFSLDKVLWTASKRRSFQLGELRPTCQSGARVRRPLSVTMAGRSAFEHLPSGR